MRDTAIPDSRATLEQDVVFVVTPTNETQARNKSSLCAVNTKTLRIFSISVAKSGIFEDVYGVNHRPSDSYHRSYPWLIITAFYYIN